ncbi:MAG: gluconate 2-dehydrogenase subunit 3 family protein [Gemmatimonadaceae bacterium]|nr:gluconate 2-dehydrogenase subunit 3 family protein [Gemmatimonadaceae bacterium]
MYDPYAMVPARAREEEDVPLEVVNRREAIRRVSALLGGVALVGGSALWTAGCTPQDGAKTATSDSGAAPADGPIGTFTKEDIAFLDEVAETILPTTAKSPGAKAAKTGAFLALMVTDCYEPKDQEIFRGGMKAIEDACSKAHSHGFMAAKPEERLAVLAAMDAEQHAFMKTKKPEDPTPAFRMIKELSLLGFFTSEIGYTKAMRYVETPGRFDPCVPMAAGETSWADHA